ncbi:N-lysine methyltransferase SMYD2-A-like [Oppia nitens]|uniref:N-lysine methyltransferase SMYD2-A-like n=1 Tax=Oppia nitens TaxID=1686743 RepID=UPI0023DC5E23|nr:N-lysine methyltransferase SMYD2-A-like [Oppia nitens]
MALLDKQIDTMKSLKHYRRGDVIMTVRPLVYVVADQMKGRICDYCLTARPSLMSCSDCEQQLYCNQICQHNDWDYHRLECPTLAYSPTIKSAEKLMIRLWLAIQDNRDIVDKQYPLPNGQYLSLNDLKVNNDFDKDLFLFGSDETQLNEILSEVIEAVSDEDLDENISMKDKALIQFKSLVETFNECKIHFDLYTLWQLFLKVWSNVLTIDVLDFDNEECAYGLFIESASLNHSCEPNACYVSYGTRLQVRAIKPIKPNDEIFISYIDLANDTSVRQKMLKSFHVICDCLKCRNNTSDSNIDYSLFHKLNNDFGHKFFTLMNVKNGLTSSIAELISIADELVPYYDNIFPDFYPQKSLYLVKYLKLILLNVIETKTAAINREFVAFVLKNVSITHGVDHKIYRKVCVVRHITLLDLESDTDHMLQTLKSKPISALKKYTIYSIILVILCFIFYNNFDLIYQHFFL